MSVYPRQKTNELLGLLMLAASAFLLLSLTSYHPLDGSLNVSAARPSFVNTTGKIGAWTADFMLQGLGLASFLLPLFLVFLSYPKLRGRALEYALMRAIGLAAVIASLAAVLFLLEDRLPFALDYAAGGVTGILLGNLLRDWLNPGGALLLLSTVIAASLLLCTSFSIDRALSWLAARNMDVIGGLRERGGSWKRSRETHREYKKLQSDQRSVTAQLPPRKISLDPEQIPEAGPPEREDVAPRTTEPPRLVRDPVRRETTALPEEDASGLTGIEARPFQIPSLDFLNPQVEQVGIDEGELIELAQRLADKYAEFGEGGRVIQIHPGPVVTTFEFKPDPGVKYSKIVSLAEDLCLALKAESIRIDRIPGKNTVGIEVPNHSRQPIMLRTILDSVVFQESRSALTLGLGSLINGNTYVTNLAQMPHLLIAGATGSGKSVAVNCLVCSILYKATPDQVRFIMIDPKRLELGLYADIPHLLTPIVTDPRQAANSLAWAVREMEERYRLLARQGVRNLAQYNEMVSQLTDNMTPEGEQLEPLPMIVIIVDELADLMMTAGKEVEMSLTRLAQMARAIGIHLVLATQRPSVDVITGLIKANFPSRISFRVSTKVDSRTVLDTNGAEQLLGQGDMLFLSPRTSRPIRIHGALITEKEIQKVTEFLRNQGEPSYREEILEADEEEKETAVVNLEDLDDPLFQEASRFVVETGKASTSLLQRRLRIGYGRAARLLDIMEHEGIIGPPDGSRPREVLVPPNYFDEMSGD